jgi:hypothetical protein
MSRLQSSPLWQALRAWQRGVSRMMWWIVALALLLQAVAIAIAGWSAGGAPPTQVASIVAGAAAIVGLFFWILLVTGVLRQNDPATACLVPGHTRALRRLLLVGWLAMTLMLGGSGAALGHGWLASLAFAAGWTTGLAWLIRAPLLLLPFWLLGVGAIDRVSWSTLAQAAAPWLGDAATAMLCVVIIALGWSVTGIVRSGGRRHEADHQRRRKQDELARGSVSAATGRDDHDTAMQPFMRAFMWFSVSLYDRWMVHVLRRRPVPWRSRLLLAFGPSLHWTGVLGTGVPVTASLATLFVILALIDNFVSASQAIGFILACACIGGVIFVLAQLWSARSILDSTRTEQSLVMLAPGVPRGAALNRLLALSFMGQLAMSLAATLVLLYLATFVVSGQLMSAAVWLGLLACMPTSLLLWQDWSRSPDQRSSWRLPVIASAAAAAPALAVNLLPAAAWLPWAAAAVFLAVTVVAGTVVWQRAARWPSALPSGRFGQR